MKILKKSFYQVMITRHEENSDRHVIAKMIGNYDSKEEAEALVNQINTPIPDVQCPWQASMVKVMIL